MAPANCVILSDRSVLLPAVFTTRDQLFNQNKCTWLQAENWKCQLQAKKNKLRCNGCYRMRFTKDGIFILCAVQGDLQLTVQKTHNNSKISSHPERLTGRFVCVCARARVFSHP